MDEPIHTLRTPILAAKFYIPPLRADNVARTRLLRQLEEALRCSLILISAPAGYGKTTLLSEWIRREKVRGTVDFSWLSLDRTDDAPRRFWKYFIYALQSARPGFGAETLQLLDEYEGLPLEHFLTLILNELAGLEKPLILILDDYHLIQSQAIHDGMVFLLEHQLPQFNLALGTRADPPWPIARLRTQGCVLELRQNDLRFTPEEAASFLNQSMELSLEPEAVNALEERTEGWIAGLQMAALSLRKRSNVEGFISAFTGSHRYIFDYLLEEVIQKQPPAVRDFLLGTSVLERLCTSLCDFVLERNDSQHMLAEVERLNLFLVPLDDERCWYRYHHLFSGLLLRQLQDTSPARAEVLRRRASEWCESSGLSEEAVQYALAGKDMERAAQLIEGYALRMMMGTKHPTLSGWFEMLPPELVRIRPRLSIYQAWALYWTGQREQGEKCLRHAEQALASTSAALSIPDKEKQLIDGYLAAVWSYYALTKEDLPRVLEQAQKALALLPGDIYMRGLAALTLGFAYFGTGDIIASEQAYAEAGATARKSGHRFLVVATACYAGYQQAKQAQLNEAYGTYLRALELGTGPGGRPLPMASFPLIKLGDLWREWNDFQTARDYLSKGIELSEQLGQADILAEGYVAQARLLLSEGALFQANAIIEKADEIVRKMSIDPWVRCWLDDSRLRLWLAMGNLPAAVQWARDSGMRLDGELNYLHDLHHLNLARLLVARGEQKPESPYLDQALRLLQRILEAARRAHWKQEAIKALILQAIAHQARGDCEQAVNALLQALEWAEPGGYVSIFIDEGEPVRLLVADLRSKFAELTIGKDKAQKARLKSYANRLSAALDARPKDGQILIQAAHSTRVIQHPAPVEQLSARELEVLQLLKTSLTVPEIAGRLVVSANTARSHIKSIYSKLNVHRRIDAIRAAEELGL